MKALKAVPVLLALSVFATPAFGESGTHCVSVHVIDWYIELRNECDRDVHYKYCIVNANTSGTSLIGAGPMAALHDCEGKIGGGAGRISAGGRSAVVQSDALGENSEFRWFACAMPRLPEDWDWKTNRGYCRTAKESAAAARRKAGRSGDVPRDSRGGRRALQTALKTEGFNPGPADGSFGPRTRAAVQAWQRSIGQEPTGELTANQMRRLLPGRLEEPQQAEPSAGGGWEAPESVVSASAAAALSPKCDELPGSYPGSGDHRGPNHAFAQCWQELDEVPGCFVYRDHYHSGDKVTRGRGECRRGVVERGSITIEGNDGSVRKGPIVDGKRNGRWVLRFAGGDVREGPYVDGKQNGRWVLRFADGRVDEGPYVDGKLSGRWVQRFASGTVAAGPVVDGKKNGRWVIRKADGTTFDNCFRANNRVDCN